jgi:8-amino-7-oxononanoate synthase
MASGRNWQAKLDELERANRRRRLREVMGPQGSSVSLDGRQVANFSSNNYLGFASQPTIASAMQAALTENGVGAGASRLIVGNHHEHLALEAAIAAFHGRPAARLFNSGYHANIGTIQALVGPGDTVYSDALNHASIIDGCRLSRARVRIYPHGDTAALAQMIAADGEPSGLIVTDSVFSMDGDVAPLPELASLAAEHGLALMVDEAHATGVLGEGRGASAMLGVVPDIQMGTLSKALGCFGAYVACETAVAEWLLNRARSFVFTTGLPPALAAASRAAVELAGGSIGDGARGALRARMAQFADGLAKLNLLPSGAGRTPIFPVLIGDESQTMAACAALLERGIYAQGIRPPTVPRGTSRLRFSLMSTHSEDDVAAALEALQQLVAAGSIPTIGDAE